MFLVPVIIVAEIFFARWSLWNSSLGYTGEQRVTVIQSARLKHRGPDLQQNRGPDLQQNRGPDLQQNHGPDLQQNHRLTLF